MLNPRTLEVLLAVVDEGSFSEAAHALWCTQSAVTQQIQALERKVGGPVIVRGTRPAQVTEVGEVLVRHGREIVARLRDAEREAVDASRRAHRLRLASFATGSAPFVQAALAQRDRFASGQLEMVITDPQDSLAAVAARAVDLALVFDYGAVDPAPANVKTHHIVSEPMMLAMSSAHELSRKATLTFGEVSQSPWVSGRNHMCQQALATACAAAGFEPRVVHTTDDYEAALAVVLTSECVTLVPRLVARQLPPGIRVFDLPGVLPRRAVRLARLRAREDLEPSSQFLADLGSLVGSEGMTSAAS